MPHIQIVRSPMAWVCVLVATGLSLVSPVVPLNAAHEGTSAAPRSARAQTSVLVTLTNAERTREGLEALQLNERLMRAAQIQAEQMARAGRLEHVLESARYPRPADRLAAAGYRWEARGENVALGQPTAEEAIRSWMRSSGHRANILNSSYTELGTGYAKDDEGRPFYVQVFGRPLSSTARRAPTQPPANGSS